VAVILRGLRELAGRDIRPIRAAFAHARNADLPEFTRFFGCPVEFGRAVDEGVASDLLEFSADAVAAPLLTADPKLLKALEPFCDMAAKERRTASDTLRAAVEKEAEKLLPHGKAQKQIVARALGMSTRTLARRLGVEGTTYEDVIDELRRSLALQYLKDPACPFPRSLGCWATRGRPPSTMLLDAGLVIRRLWLARGCRFSRIGPDPGSDHPAAVPRRRWPEKAEDWHARTGSSARYRLPDFP
jgi:AraC-like DNA-binding protein